MQNPADRFHGLGRRVHTDDGVPAPKQQAINRGQQNPAEIVGRMIGLHPNAQDAGLAHGIPTARDITDFTGGHNQVFIAHQLGDRRCDLRDNRPVECPQTVTSLVLVQYILTQLADGQMGKRTERRLVVGFKNKPAHFVLGGVYERIRHDVRQRNIGQDQLGRNPFLLGACGNPGQAVARLVFIGLGKHFAQVGEGKTLATNGCGVAHTTLRPTSHTVDSPKRIVRNRKEFVNTETELKAMADAATMGSSRTPKNG